MDHVGDYIEMTGKSLGWVSDQIGECAHSALHRRLAISNYWVKNKETDIHCIKLFRGIVHFNSYKLSLIESGNLAFNVRRTNNYNRNYPSLTQVQHPSYRAVYGPAMSCIMAQNSS